MITAMSKRQFLVTLFLFTPSITVPMKRSHSALENGQLTIIEILNEERSNFLTQEGNSPKSIAYFQENHHLFINRYHNKYTLEEYRYNEASFLGIVACSIHAYQFDKDRKCFKDASFLEKKKVVTHLLSCGLEPTQKDKQFALVEKYNRSQPLMRKIYLCLSSQQNHSSILSQMPQKLIKYISYLMFDTEESLF